ncbi:MAG TPA: type VI secretion protein IcmF/TssM N-terminal domain-containing protein [Planctomicrobium sp.]|nr:type VI secretion protein IcmF/TssM N-terminal domain-containing protein [Planctomicrobium sp.]
MGLSLPARLTIFSLLFLLLCAGLSWFLFLSTWNRADMKIFWQTSWIAGLLLLLIPIGVYFLTRSWMEGEQSDYPEIDQAWAAGIEALKQHQIEITDVPLFLVTGIQDDKHARNVLAASELSFAVNGVPEGPAPIHWFANNDTIFLCLSQVTCVGALRHKFEEAGTAPIAGHAPTKAKGVFSETMRFDTPAGEGPEPTGRSVEYDSSAEVMTAPAPQVQAYTGTAAAFAPVDLSVPVGGHQQGGEQRAIVAAIKLTEGEKQDRSRKLTNVLDRLRFAREPVSPVNGILSLIPFSAIRAGSAQAEEVATAAESDITVLRDRLRVRCAVSALVDGMETESGFRELARRIGRDVVKANRFGKGTPQIWSVATDSNIEAIVRHACGAFEDWIYHLFSQPGGLSKVNNPKLYSLLCLMRGDVQEQLIKVLHRAYGKESDAPNQVPEWMMFSGCYFSATGGSEDKQAFVKSVFDKLVEQQSVLTWNDQALAEAERYRLIGRVANTLSLILLIGLVGAIVISRPQVQATFRQILNLN